MLYKSEPDDEGEGDEKTREIKMSAAGSCVCNASCHVLRLFVLEHHVLVEIYSLWPCPRRHFSGHYIGYVVCGHMASCPSAGGKTLMPVISTPSGFFRSIVCYTQFARTLSLNIVSVGRMFSSQGHIKFPFAILQVLCRILQENDTSLGAICNLV